MSDHEARVVLVEVAGSVWAPGGLVVRAVTSVGWPMISTDAVMVARRAHRIEAEQARALAAEAARHGLRVVVVGVQWRAARCRAEVVVGDPGAMPDMPSRSPGRHASPVRSRPGRRR